MGQHIEGYLYEWPLEVEIEQLPHRKIVVYNRLAAQVSKLSEMNTSQLKHRRS
jgi:hypothetical protein